MRPDSITLAIFEKYSPEELAETAQKLVQALADKETAETEKKMSDSVFNERIKTHDAAAAELAKKYGKGGETAQIAQPTDDQVNDALKSITELPTPPPPDEEVTRICPYPGCCHFADHDGDHTPPMDVAPPEAEKPKRKRKSKLPEVPPPSVNEPPADSQGLD